MIIDLKNAESGIFLEETKNRFRCVVEICGKKNTCYVASSSRLSKYICLEGRNVLVVPNRSTTGKTLLALKTQQGYILLHLSLANYIVSTQLHKRFFDFLGRRKEISLEKIVDGYKADIYINDTKTVIEIKTVLKEDRSATFPTTFSERSIKQLEKLNELMDKGYQVCYLFVSLNPKTKEIILDRDSELYGRIVSLKERGAISKACAIKLNDDGDVTIFNSELRW